MITLHFTIDQFQRLLAVMLADPTPDRLTDLVLMACKRPKAGIIAVPVPPDDAALIATVVESATIANPDIGEIALLVRSQIQSCRPVL